MKLKNVLLILFLQHFFLVAQVTRNYNVILRGNASSTSQLHTTLWDGNLLPIWGMAPTLSAVPTVPAKILYANEGDTVIINARSVAQGQHHTIHLHGLDVDTRNDGDPMTSFVLNHMQDTTYTFYAKHAGTYMYHCHVASVVHIQMGMYGLIVVKAAGGAKTAWTGGPAFDKDYKWLLSEVDKSWHDSIPPHDSAGHVSNVPNYVADYFWVNGKSKQQIASDDSTKITGAVAQKIFMRIGGIGFYSNQIIFPTSLNAVIIDSDGRPLPNLITSDTLNIMPGERYGVMLTPSSQIVDSVIVNYINMNTGVICGTEYVPVTISGFIGLNEFKNDFFAEAFPNPVADLLTVKWNQGEVKSLEVYNALGQKNSSTGINNYTIQNNMLELNVSQLANGIYFLQLINNRGDKSTLKFNVYK